MISGTATSTTTTVASAGAGTTADTDAILADVPSAIVATKARLREQIGDYAGVFAELESAIRAEVAEIVAARESGASLWPVVQRSDIVAGTVPAGVADAIHRRGCAVVRNTFSREQAEEWDRLLVRYVDDNHFEETYQRIDDGVFGGLAEGKPAIFPIYWSAPQMEARQHPDMEAVRQFLNGFWTSESEGKVWFDPSRDTAYPDRVRRRPPGTTSAGLSAHTDSGSIERWLTPAYQQVFRHVFDGNWRDYDAWDGAYRADVDEFTSTVMCSAFRTFQGWTALSDMQPEDGVLNVVPIPHAMAYMLLRALQDDVDDDDLCGAANGQALPVTEKFHSILLPALTPIPAVEPGDTVWWHGDLIHSVAAVDDQNGWGNVMYIPATPGCAKNDAYAASCGTAFVEGRSPSDFAPEDYEVTWSGRPSPSELSELGRSQLQL